MGIRQTHTYVTLEISEAAWKEIYDKMDNAGYDHAFNDEGEIDMHGIALVKANYLKRAIMELDK